MTTKILNAKQLANTLPKLFDKHNEIYMSVAWGSDGKAAEALFDNETKFKSITVGVAFHQTHPDFIDRMVNARNTYIVNSSSNSVFHPKLYFFVTDNHAEAIIGSSNFTHGGLGKNTETNVHIKGNINDPVFGQIRETFESLSSMQESVTQDFATVYRTKWEVARQYKKPPHPSTNISAKNASVFSSDLVNMKWKDYVAAIQSNQNMDMRLSVLREVQKMFAGVSSFGDVNEFERKAIAGFIGETQKKDAGLDGFVWGYFGSMIGAGVFKSLVNGGNKNLVAALDSIPPRGDIEKYHYDEYCEKFITAFKHTGRTGTHRTASRLLAMKRPDTFVCVCGPNEEGFSDALGCDGSDFNLETYWDLVIEPIRASKWYNEARPKKAQDAELWDKRAAMLDAIYYDPGTN